MHDFLRLMVWVASLCCEQFHRHNSTLQKLDLADNQISDAGAVALADGLRCGGLHSCLLYFAVFCAGFCRCLITPLLSCCCGGGAWHWVLVLDGMNGRITRLVLVGLRITRSLD
jgi:hypothetical protein